MNNLRGQTRKLGAAVRNGSASRRPRIGVADDSTVAREGIVAIIRRDLCYALCGLATDQRATIELVEKHQPDLLLIEPFVGNCDGIFFLSNAKSRDVKTT